MFQQDDVIIGTKRIREKYRVPIQKPYINCFVIYVLLFLEFK